MFPLKEYQYSIPESNVPGGFGFVRKYDIHTGIDLYCEKNDKVYSITNGLVTNIIKFTGFDESPWWNDTYAIMVYSSELDKTLLYGELKPIEGLSIGDFVTENQLLGNVLTVLKKDKGKNPPNMLHFELYNGYQTQAVWWQYNQKKPNNLLNPYHLLNEHYRNQ